MSTFDKYVKKVMSFLLTKIPTKKNFFSNNRTTIEGLFTLFGRGGGDTKKKKEVILLLKYNLKK